MDTAASLLCYGLPLVIMGLGTVAAIARVLDSQVLIPVPVRVQRTRR